ISRPRAWQAMSGGTPLGQTLRRGWIVRWLQNPQAMKPDVLEPRYGFSEEQARALAAYLMTLGPERQGAAP
ncbi:MAG: hypothetical protein AAB113_01815, partial [Candidatus Eisenbacteria bacterium]